MNLMGRPAGAPRFIVNASDCQEQRKAIHYESLCC